MYLNLTFTLEVPCKPVSGIQYSVGIKGRMSFFCIDMEIASHFNVFEKNIYMRDVLALANEKTDCSGFSWIVSIMVNGFSKCQSSCFIDLASQRGEQTHLDGISLTAKTAPCVHRPNQEVMWISLCPFVIRTPQYPISDRSFPEPSASLLLSVSLFTLVIWVADSLSCFL